MCGCGWGREKGRERGSGRGDGMFGWNRGRGGEEGACLRKTESVHVSVSHLWLRWHGGEGHTGGFRSEDLLLHWESLHPQTHLLLDDITGHWGGHNRKG